MGQSKRDELPSTEEQLLAGRSNDQLTWAYDRLAIPEEHRVYVERLMLDERLTICNQPAVRFEECEFGGENAEPEGIERP